jgi:peptide/nickel transport system substrate-binding protein
VSKKWITSLVAVFFIISLALVGCSSSNSSGKPSDSSEGSNSGGSSENTSNVPQEITYATTTDVVGLSPIETNDSASSSVLTQIYETLFTRNAETMEIEPLLVDSYENPDNLTWVMKLKEGISFHDGTPFNAEAVKYTFDKFRDPATAAPRASLLEPIESVEVQDEFTVVIKTKYPYGAMLAALSHQNAAIVSPTADKGGELNQKPVGTGPFKFVEWVQGDHITLEGYADYWQGAPKLEKVTFRVVPEVNTAVSMLQAGEVQFITGLQSELLPRLESLENVEIVTREGTPVTYLGFNMEKAPMNDLKFRQAVAHAINRGAYIEHLKGLGVASNSIIGPKVFGYNESAEELGYEYDVEKAKKLIEENGFSGTKVKMLVANTPVYVKISEIVQAQLKEVGIDAQIELLEWGTFLDVSGKGEFDITFLGWTNSTADGSELLYPNLHADNIGASNRVRYNNPEFNKLVEESRTAVDQEERKAKLDEANKLAIQDAPWVVMNHGIVTAAVDKSVKGFEMDPTGQWSLYNVYRE